VRGAFTGATSDRPGKLDVAHGGTLFLDEIGELPLALQPKLLRALQQGEIQRVGSDRPVRVDVRLLAATNRDLAEAVRTGTFRADLYHRLNVYPIAVPPLRARRDDIPILAGHFCEVLRARLGTGPVRLHPDVVATLEAYDWPGNVRELENVLSRLVLRASSRARGATLVLVDVGVLEDEWLPRPASGGSAARAAPTAGLVDGPPLPFREAVRRYERALLERELAQHGGNWSAAARSLGLDRGNIHHLARRLGLRPDGAVATAAPTKKRRGSPG
jgi:anaerobic nitric oxide reductase transcription regulator